MTDNGSEWQPPQPTPAPWSPGRSVVPASGPVGFRFNSGVAALVAVLLVVVGAGGYVLMHHSPHRAAASLAPVVVTPVVPAVASPAPASSSPPNDAKVSATGWDNTVAHPVTAPVVVGNRVVVYTADAGQLTIRAFDPITGATAWALPASPSGETAGQPFEVAHTADTVFYFKPGEDPSTELAQVAAVDVATGKQKWATVDSYVFAGLPALCTDKTALCMSVYYASSAAMSMRFDLATGHVTPLGQGAGRSLGPGGLEDPGNRGPEYTERVNDATGMVTWKDDVAKLNRTPVSSDSGWDWDLFGDVYVGWMGSVHNPSSKTINLNAMETFGVRATDGVLLWRHVGLYGCPSDGQLDNGQPFAVRCVIAGTATVDATGQNFVFKGLDVTLQGFNPRTGATLWSRHLGNSPAAIGAPGSLPVRMGADTFAFTNVAGVTIIVNLRTGLETLPVAGVNGWCDQSDTSYTVTGFNESDGTPTHFSTEGVGAPCTFAGKAAPPANGTLAQAGVSLGGYFVWSSKDGIHAFKLPA
jgi:PQQ-like domain